MVEWSFLLKVLNVLKIPEVFIQWIACSLTTPKFSLTLNGDWLVTLKGKGGVETKRSLVPLPLCHFYGSFI